MSTFSPTESEPMAHEIADDPRGESSQAADGSSTQSSYEIVLTPPLSPGEAEPERQALNLPCVILGSYNPNRTFFPREDIMQTIGDALLPQKAQTASMPGLQQFALCGLGGVGKTEIALEFALRNKECFDAVFWVHADSLAKLDDSFQEISLKLGLEDSSECKSHAVTRSLVKGWLSNPQNETPINVHDNASTTSSLNEAKWLIIFDNADDPQILADYWPQGTGSILITSRDPIAKSLFAVRSSGIDLESLNDEDGGALLIKLTALDENSEDNAQEFAQRISHQLGGLPLAISQMAGIIKRQDLGLSEFLTLYQDSQEHEGLHGTKFDLSNNTYSYSIATVWAFENLSDTSQFLLKVMSFMDPDSIQEDILFETNPQLTTAPFSEKEGREARIELTQSSLIKRDKQKNQLSGHRLSMHRLVQDVVRAKMTPDELSGLFQLVVTILWANWPSAMPKPSNVLSITPPKASNRRLEIGRWPLCAALYPHILSLKQLWPRITSWFTYMKPKFAALLNDGAWYQSERGRTRHFDGFFDLAQSLCRDVEEGVAALLREKEIRVALGSYVPLSREANLGLVYMLQGKLEAAESVLLESLDTRVKILGKNDKESFRTGRVLYALGNLRSLQGRQDEAFACHKQAYQQFRDTIGLHHHRTADVTHKVAEHLVRLGEFDKAITTIDDALQAWSYDVDVYKPELARTTFLKAMVLLQSGNTFEANVVFKVAGRLRGELVPDDRTNIADLTMQDFDSLVTFWSR